MEKETLKNIFNFLEEKEGHNTPFIWKLKNNIPLSEEELDVKGNLNLTDKNITSLPKGLKVYGSIMLNLSHLDEISNYRLRKMIQPGFIKGKIVR